MLSLRKICENTSQQKTRILANFTQCIFYLDTETAKRYDQEN